MRAPLQENSFKQEFIYNGKIGNQAKFIYREFEDDVNSSIFKQDLIKVAKKVSKEAARLPK